MKVTVEESYKNYKLFSIQIRQGNQFFRLDYHASKAECQWMAKMFRKALKKYDAEAQNFTR